MIITIRKTEIGENATHTGAFLFMASLAKRPKTWKNILRCKQILRISNAVLFLGVVVQTKYSNPQQIVKDWVGDTKGALHVLSNWRKHPTRSLRRIVRDIWWSTMLTNACYWPSVHCIPAQNLCPFRRRKITTVHRAHLAPTKLLSVTTHTDWIDRNSRVFTDITVGSWIVNRMFFEHVACILRTGYLLDRVSDACSRNEKLNHSIVCVYSETQVNAICR